ncbi:DUF3566 domain-containing protein [Nonomuraea sp. NPDC049309]|uniref:DUF3566 domain-containing protein n=1 Tax=Nonomuraea sp. NPDC049309 TaxID=3364350 RepID=UPI003714C78C
MSAQGGTARTTAASGNGQQPKKPTDNEISHKADDGKDTSPAQGRPVQEPQPHAAGSMSPSAPPAGPQAGNNDTVRLRPSLATEAPPAPETSSSKKKKSASSGRLPRKAHLVLRRIEPWSAMKFSFVVSLVCFVVLFVAVAVLYGVLSGLGVFDSIVDLVNQLGKGEQGQSSIPIDIASWFEPVRILGYTALIGAVNVVLITALATLGAVIYNIASDLVGGVEVTFSEAE